MKILREIAEQILLDNKRRYRWRALATVMAAVIVFTTTYFMILPAITVSVEDAEEMPGMDLLEEASLEEDLEAEDLIGLEMEEMAEEDGTGLVTFAEEDELAVEEDSPILIDEEDSLSDIYANLPGIDLDEFAPKEVILRAECKTDHLLAQVRMETGAGSPIGDDAYLEIQELTGVGEDVTPEEAAVYRTHLEETWKALSEEKAGWVSTKISLYDLVILNESDEQLEPSDEVQVKLTFAEPQDAEEVQILHFAKDMATGEEQEPAFIEDILLETNANGNIVSCTFETDSLSVYAVVPGGYVVETEENAEVLPETEEEAVIEIEDIEEKTETEAVESATEETTESVTEETTESATEETTESVTEENTESATEETTESVTEEATESATEEATESVTEEATESVTEEDIESVTEEAVEEETEPEYPKQGVLRRYRIRSCRRIC